MKWRSGVTQQLNVEIECLKLHVHIAWEQLDIKQALTRSTKAFSAPNLAISTSLLMSSSARCLASMLILLRSTIPEAWM